MAVIERNQAFAPFFGRPMSFIKGQGPLGLQNTSEATFALLLPGLNNVTGRIRYYSFCCWLLEEYAQRIGSTDPAEQKGFMRRGELIIAYINRFSGDDSVRVPGSLYVNRQLKEPVAIYDLQQGTYNNNGSTTDTYWQNPGGAFGQYYSGALQDIGIASRRSEGSDVYARTAIREHYPVSGEALAKAFDANISAPNKKQFFKSLQNRKLAHKDLDALRGDFDIMTVPPGTEERKLLIELLLQNDYPLLQHETPSKFRRNTIHLLLRYAKEFGYVDVREFTEYAYQQKGIQDGARHECLTGWHYYQVNEYWQFACQGIFNGIMYLLEEQVGSGWMGLYPLVEQVASDTVNQLRLRNLATTGEDTVETVTHAITDTDEDSLLDAIADSDGVERIAYSIELILFIYRKNLDCLEHLKAFGTNYQVERDGDSVTYFLSFEKYHSMSISSFLQQFFLSNVIYRHQYVAFRKMRGSTQSTQLFLLEDGSIRKLKNNFEPGLTSPRIGRVIEFLVNLGILTEENALTKEGTALLKQIEREPA